MKVYKYVVGRLGTNCYIAADESSLEAVMIDPGAEAERLLTAIKDKNLKLKYVILTHCHFDHILALNDIIDATGAGLIIHENDEPYLYDPRLNLSGRFTDNYVCRSKPEATVKDGDKIVFGSTELTVIHTPGHTPGSMCLQNGDTLFTGDTVMKGCIGRYDFPGGDYKTIMQSVQKISALEGDRKLLPGHGTSTALSDERETNIYF